MRIYDRALSAQEVRQLYALGAANIAHSNTVTLSSGLVGYWTFNGPDINWTTNKATDASGNGNTGTLVSLATSSAPVAGKLGQALNWLGSSIQNVNLGHPASLLSPTFTVSAWVNWRGFVSGSLQYYNIISDDNTASTRSNYSFALWRSGLAAAGKPFCQFSDNSATYGSVTDSTVLPTNTWVLVTCTYDGAALKIYRNGVPTATTATSLVPSTQGTAINIGRDAYTGGTNGESWNGKIDDVRIYNRALSPQEIQQLYTMGR